MLEVMISLHAWGHWWGSTYHTTIGIIISMVSRVMHAIIGIRAEGVRSRLECSRWWRRCQVDGVRRRHQDEEDNKKVKICSKVKIDDFWRILIKVESFKAQWCSDMNTVDAEVMIRSSPMADGKMGSTSSWRHHTRHPMEARCGSKSKENNGGWWRWSTDKIDQKVDHAIIVSFRRSRCCAQTRDSAKPVSNLRDVRFEIT